MNLIYHGIYAREKRVGLSITLGLDESKQPSAVPAHECNSVPDHTISMWCGRLHVHFTALNFQQANNGYGNSHPTFIFHFYRVGNYCAIIIGILAHYYLVFINSAFISLNVIAKSIRMVQYAVAV